MQFRHSDADTPLWNHFGTGIGNDMAGHITTYEGVRGTTYRLQRQSLEVKAVPNT
jgi:hypothetical protein